MAMTGEAFLEAAADQCGVLHHSKNLPAMASLRACGSRAVLFALLSLLLSAQYIVHGIALPQDTVKPLLVPKKDGSFGSLEDTFYTASVLSSLQDPSLDPSTLCKWAGAVHLDSVSGSLHLASAVARLSALVCSQATPSSAEAEKVLLKGAKEGVTAKEVYLAVEGLAALKSKTFSAASTSEYSAAAKAAGALLESLKESSGLYRKDKDADETSALATGYALKATASLLYLDASTKSQDLAKNVKTLFSKTATGDFQTRFFKAEPEEGGPLPASALIAAGYFGVAYALGGSLEVPKETLAGLGTFLATAGAPVSLFEASLLFSALAAFDSNSLAVPLLLTVPGHASVSSPAPSVSLTSVLGRGIEGATVTLLSSRLTPKSSKLTQEVAQGKALAGAGSSFALPSDFVGPTAALGAYTLKFEVSPSDPSHVSLSPFTRSLVVTAPVTLSAVSVSVFDGDSKTAETEYKVDLASGSKAESESAFATHLQRLRVSLAATTPNGKAFVPHQAFFSMKHESGVEHVFLLKSSTQPAGQLSIELNLLENLAKLYYLSGPYSLTLTLGDTYMENSGSWSLGSAILDLPEAPEGAPKPPAVAGGALLVSRFTPEREIAHIFRLPDSRPPHVVSYAFAAAVFVPLLFLLVGFSALGVNLKLFPSSGLPFLSALGFHGGIAAMLLLYLAFWVEVKLFTAAKILLVLALVTSVPGHYILSYLADSSSKLKTN